MDKSRLPLNQRCQQSTRINVPPGINQFCAIYWDIENIAVQCNETAVQLIKLIRDRVIRANKLEEIEFIAVFGEGKLSPVVENQIKGLGVEIYDDVGYARNAADSKLIDLISKFVKNYGPGCSIILISGDTDFVKTLYRSKIKYNVNIYLIHYYGHKNDFLDAIADEVYVFMDDGQLRRVTDACDVAVLAIKPSTEVFTSPTIKNDLLSIFRDKGVTNESIYFDDRDKEVKSIWIGFPSKELAKNVIDSLKRHDHKLLSDIKYVQYPPNHVITQLIGQNIGSVREETLNTLRLLNTRLLSSSEASLTPSTLSLTFKTIPAYLIVTGFPYTVKHFQRCRYLARLLNKPPKSFTVSGNYVWLHVTQPYQAKEYIDKINKSRCNGAKLSATVEKHLPGQVRITISQPDSEELDTNICTTQCIELFAFVALVIVIIIVIIWARS